MRFDDDVRRTFPGALALMAYPSHAQGALARFGLVPGSTLAGVVTCPDELCDNSRQELRRAWGPTMDGAALAGVPTFGRFWYAAALSHAPLRLGRRRVVVFVQVHLGFSTDGQPGACVRPGVDGPSVACGALAQLSQALAHGEGPALASSVDPDLEAMAALTRAVGPFVPADVAPDLVAVTRAALDAAVFTVRRQLAAVTAAAGSIGIDYAVLPGIQLHGPPGRDMVWPAAGWVVRDGISVDLPLD